MRNALARLLERRHALRDLGNFLFNRELLIPASDRAVQAICSQGWRPDESGGAHERERIRYLHEDRFDVQQQQHDCYMARALHIA